MKKIIFLLLIILINLNFNLLAEENNCESLNKFSNEYRKCKSNLLKQNIISKSKLILDDTKNYQKKEWSKEKDKLDKIKKKVLD